MNLNFDDSIIQMFIKKARRKGLTLLLKIVIEALLLHFMIYNDSYNELKLQVS